MADSSLFVADRIRMPEEVVAPGDLDTRLRDADAPFVLRGVAADWPLVAAGRDGSETARQYLLEYARDRNFEVQIGRPGTDRVFYDEHMGLDFRDERWPLAKAFDFLTQAGERDAPPLVYLPSIEIGAYFVGLDDANHLPLGARQARAGIWIGGKTRIAAHNDIANNVAVAAVGRRRFTLFPPAQFANLYLGPLDHSPGGRPISMVDFANPDFAAYPRFREALDQAMVAELEPGDALFIPAMWYHHVEALDRFNVLVNYWWNDEPRFLGHPEDALYHAILALRDLPADGRAHWKRMFDHYVFEPPADIADHIPERGRGVLARLDGPAAQKLRAYLLRRLNQ